MEPERSGSPNSTMTEASESEPLCDTVGADEDSLKSESSNNRCGADDARATTGLLGATGLLGPNEEDAPMLKSYNAFLKLERLELLPFGRTHSNEPERSGSPKSTLTKVSDSKPPGKSEEMRSFCVSCGADEASLASSSNNLCGADDTRAGTVLVGPAEEAGLMPKSNKRGITGDALPSEFLKLERLELSPLTFAEGSDSSGSLKSSLIEESDGKPPAEPEHD
mmetsp:Transcript_20382/g.50878  ORF Transcript_20382/g.50878 Transcript_20382/m.50878 type:complete len:223 (-) Transcript_20382:325-993(-)